MTCKETYYFSAKCLAISNSNKNLVIVGDKTISNYIHNLAGFATDFPIAEELTTEQLAL